jgi:uncharacterized LabA/DUF88 family protein
VDLQVPKKKVIAYIDGFNLYYGLCASSYRKYLWLNLQGMALSLIRNDQELVATKYFTARISGGRPSDKPSYAAKRNGKRKRQATFLDALGTVPNLQIFYGQYLDDPVQCRKCGASWMDAEEKMTDVNIATEMLVDAFASRYDVALLVSGDSDLVPPIKAIKSCFPHKRINIAFPPGRSSVELTQTAHGQCIIGKGTIKKNQFPNEVRTTSGFVLRKPTDWS